MERVKWIERKFNLETDPLLLPYLLERLHGTYFRAKSMVEKVPDEKLSVQYNNTWSVKQHIGHLTDLEEIHLIRLNELLSGKN